MTPADPARIHLLPAKDVPLVTILRRKPSKCFHVLRWNTRTGEVESGSWFDGKLYPKRCDVSFDGQWMVYLAMGASGNTWNGLCRLPYLKTQMEGPNMGTWFGGGYFYDGYTLLLNGWQPVKGRSPFRTEPMQPLFGGEDLSVWFARMARDGWVRMGENYGESRRLTDIPGYRVECVGDDGWRHQPTKRDPPLFAHYAGYLEHGYTLRYSLEGYPDLLDEHVDSACRDSLGNLIYSRLGIVYRFSRGDLRRGEPSQVLDLEGQERPEA